MEKREEGSEFTGLSREEIVARFDELSKTKEVPELMPLAEELESAYNELLNERKEDEKQKFLDEGGSEFDFVYHRDHTDGRFAELYNLFKDRKNKFFEEKKTHERDNLVAKQQVVTDLKTLIEKGDSVGKAFQQFRELRDRWKNIGEIPKKNEEQLESDYRHQRERFYHMIQLTQGMKELDLQKHLEEKEHLLKRMEELMGERTIRRVEELIRKYREDWYDIGPVPALKKDEIISRFNENSERVFTKIHAHYEGLKKKYEENLLAKLALCEKVETVAQEEIFHPRDWERKTKEILELQQEWRKIGRVMKEEAEAVWERFRKASNDFFEKKRAFYETLKKDYDANKQAKVKVCEQAEALQTSNDWDNTAQKLIRLQRQWENIGPAGLYKTDQTLWNRFRAACNAFFDSRKKQFAAQEEERKNNLAKREQIVKKLEELISSISSTEALPTIKAIAKEWDEAGEVPMDAREAVFKKYTQAVDACYERMGMNESDKEILKFQNKVERMKGAPDSMRLLEDEKRFLRTKIRTVEDEVAKTENNMGFFAKSKNVGALLEGVMKGVEESKAQLAFLKKKLGVLEKNLPRQEQIR